MKKSLLSLALLATITVAYAGENIAVVDLQQLVSSSGQVKQLKQEHSKKINELDKILINARGEISNEKDPAKVLLIEDKYMKEFNAKKESLERDYNNRLSVVTHLAKDREELFGFLRSKNGGGLVEDKYICASVEHLDNLNRLLLGYSHLVYLLAGVNVEAVASADFEHLCRRLLLVK